jgi:hypothetical protein
MCLPLRFAGIFKILASFAEFRTWLECLVSRKCCDKLHVKTIYNYKCAAYHLIIDGELWNETQPKHTLKSRTWLAYSLKWWQRAEKHNRERKISAKSLFVFYREGIISPVVLTKRVMERARFIQLLPNFATMYNNIRGAKSCSRFSFNALQ